MLRAIVHLPSNSYGAMHDIPNLAPRDKWAMDVARQLDAAVIKRSNVIEIDYRDGNRHWTKELSSR